MTNLTSIETGAKNQLLLEAIRGRDLEEFVIVGREDGHIVMIPGPIDLIEAHYMCTVGAQMALSQKFTE